MNYVETLIQVADDCPATTGTIPPKKSDKKSVANLQYELLAEQPYAFTQEELLFEVHLQHKNLSSSDIAKDVLRETFFSKPQACMRTSPLAKRYGWGVHFDKNGKVALIARESEEYQQIMEDKSLQTLKALRSSRK